MGMEFNYSNIGSLPTSAAQQAGAVTSLDTAGLDHESRIMAICSSLISLLDKRMDEQMKLMERRGQEAEKLRGLLQELNTALDQFEVGDKNEAKLNIKDVDANKAKVLQHVMDTMQACGISDLADLAPDGVFRKGSVDLAISNVTGMMDSKTQIQQKDTFTLQSLFGKRNEMFELMSTIFKKCQDSRAAIVRNI